MAFCTKCGTKLDENSRFCSGCGAPIGSTAPSAAPSAASASPAPAPYAAPAATAYASPVTAAPAAQGGGAVKVVLVIAGIVVLLFIIGIASVVYVGYRAKKALGVSVSGKTTSVTTPFGKVTSTEADVAKVASDLGIDVYPGASPVKGSGATLNIGGISVGGAEFETGDSISKVGDFYRARYPNSTIGAADENSQSIVVTAQKGVVGIDIKAVEGRTRISISRLGGAPR